MVKHQPAVHIPILNDAQSIKEIDDLYFSIPFQFRNVVKLRGRQAQADKKEWPMKQSRLDKCR